jgi:hypothetical protein
MALDLWVLGFHQCESTLDAWCAAAVGQEGPSDG